MASNSKNSLTADDDEYQVRYDGDEEDDERTIEEEEQLGSDEEDNELDHLQADADMPLDELLKLYGQNPSDAYNRSQEEDNESTSSTENTNQHNHHQFHHLLHVNGEILPDDDDDDESDDSFEPEVFKFIKVGDEYQAQVEPEAEYTGTNGKNDSREVPVDEHLWSPSSINGNDDNDEKIDEYLKKIHNEYQSTDDEISLQTLFHCKMDIESALVKFHQLPAKTIYSYSEWTFDEIQLLEAGLREYGKNFHKISLEKCKNRSVREIIHYYYQWKKSDRYRLFIEEQQHLSAIISVTDMIERLIEEQEQQLCTAVNTFNSANSSSSIRSNDLKRNSPNSSISIVTIHQQETTTTAKRSFDQVENDIEPSAKKPSINTNNSSTTTVV